MIFRRGNTLNIRWCLSASFYRGQFISSGHIDDG